MIYRLLPNFLKKDSKIEDDCDCKHVMYGYVFWNNTYEGVWYAINRDYVTPLFAGGESREQIQQYYFKHTSLSILVELILNNANDTK